MSYRLDVTFQRDWLRGGQAKDAVIVQVGCGGTGSFLAEAVCRLLIGRDADLVLVDLDRVETHNVGRQAFDPDEVGQFKAQVLAQRLAKRFGRTIGYAVRPYDAGLHSRIFRAQPSRLNLLIGAVDNAEARRALAATLDNRLDVLWLDCGNGRNSGQVLLGNATRAEDLRGAFPPKQGICTTLPAPCLQRPDLLEAPPTPLRRLDCAEAIAEEQQGSTINQVVAAVAASSVERLLDGTCRSMASYVDMDTGMLRTVPIEPSAVASASRIHRFQVP